MLFILAWGISIAHTPFDRAVKPVAGSTACQSADALRLQMIDLINEARSSTRTCGDLRYVSAAPLEWNTELEQAARNHSQQMATHNFFAHRGPDNTHVGNRVQALGYNWRVVGENIFAGIDSVEEAVYGWLESPSHCKNIMNPDFTEIGAACVRNATSQYESYWTQVFATPMQ